MAVTIKSAREIEFMREAGRILAEVHEELGSFIRPGISTLDIDMLGEKLIRSYGCTPNFLNYNGYPASICVSVNNEVVHGIPNRNHIARNENHILLRCLLQRACVRLHHNSAQPFASRVSDHCK